MELLDHAESAYRSAELELPPDYERAIGDGDFREIGIEFLRHLVEIGRLKPDDRILDIGCGLGRLAYPLRHYLSERGSYIGFDIVKWQIDWCQNTLGALDPRFSFIHRDVYHALYNAGGTGAITDLALPIEPHSVDMLIMTSVLTHLNANAIEAYMARIAGWLRQGGHYFTTAYLIGDHNRDNLTNHPRYPFREAEGDGHIRMAKGEHPLAYVACEESWLMARCRAHGLEPVKIVTGFWYDESLRAPGIPYQDILLFKATAQPGEPA
jgi:SAM-dependent methyltransferase